MRSLPKSLALLLALWLGITVACAEGIAVRKTDAQFSEGSYQLSADFDISLNSVIDEALTRGVPLYFVSEFILVRPRWYWADETIATSEQVSRLSYNRLTRQYRIAHGSLFQNFSNLDDALHIIGHQYATPINSSLLQQGTGYTAALLSKKGDYIAGTRTHLDITQLPKPLQVNALATQDWSLDSGCTDGRCTPLSAMQASSQ